MSLLKKIDPRLIPYLYGVNSPKVLKTVRHYPPSPLSDQTITSSPRQYASESQSDLKQNLSNK